MTSARKIVVVDDTPEVLELIETVLIDGGYEVVLCQDATLAVETIVTERPGLVIVDLRMGGVGEWEILDQLGMIPETARTPVIVCSGAVERLRDAEPRLHAQGHDSLTKPFNIQDLLHKVDAMFGRP